MAGQTLPNPVAEIAEAPDRADLVAAPVVLDDAFGDAVDIGRVVVEIADQRPHRFQWIIQHGAVIGLCHLGLLNLMSLCSASRNSCPDVGATAAPNPPDSRLRVDGYPSGAAPSPAPRCRCKPRHDPAEKRSHRHRSNGKRPPRRLSINVM